MPYVKTTFEEGTMLADFVDLAVVNGWTLVKQFRKASYTFTNIFYGSSASAPSANIDLF